MTITSDPHINYILISDGIMTLNLIAQVKESTLKHFSWIGYIISIIPYVVSRDTA